MGEVVGAGLLAHVPTIMLPKEVRYELNEGKEISLVTGLERLRKEVFETAEKSKDKFADLIEAIIGKI